MLVLTLGRRENRGSRSRPLRWPKRVPLVVRARARTIVFLLPRAFSILLQILTLPVPITEAEEKAREGDEAKEPAGRLCSVASTLGRHATSSPSSLRTFQIGAWPIHQMQFLSR